MVSHERVNHKPKSYDHGAELFASGGGVSVSDVGVRNFEAALGPGEAQTGPHTNGHGRRKRWVRGSCCVMLS